MACSHRRFRPRRHAGRHRARPDRHPERRVRARRTAAGRLRGGAQHDRRRRPPDDRARARARRRAASRRPSIDRMFADFIAHYAAHIADRSRPFPGLDAALDRLAARRLPLRGLHQQARRAVAAAARCARTDPALCRDLRPGHIRHPEARPGNPAADHPAGRRRRRRARSWSAIPAPTSPPPAPPACRWWRSISATPRPRSAKLAPDRLISHFDELPAAVLRSRSSPAAPAQSQNATLSFIYRNQGTLPRNVSCRGFAPRLWRHRRARRATGCTLPASHAADR